VIYISSVYINMDVSKFDSNPLRNRRGRDRMVIGFTTMQSVPITIIVVSSNRTQNRCTRYNIMWYSLSAGRWFSPGIPVSTNKTDRHDITDILLKVALNPITITTPTSGEVYSIQPIVSETYDSYYPGILLSSTNAINPNDTLKYHNLNNLQLFWAGRKSLRFLYKT
jgi:hypothetical protein